MTRKILILIVFMMICSSVALWAQANGDALFDAKCVSCHGKDGAGKTPFGQKAHIPNLASPEVQSLSDKEIYESIARGTHHKEYPHAFAMRGMSDGEIQSLVKRIRDFAKKK
jgi:mono/diheme cytochrome c family protein